MNTNNISIAVIGLGYVGLPLAVEFGKRYSTLGFDISDSRIRELQEGVDRTLEVDEAELSSARELKYSADPDDLRAAYVYIVTVPTPIDAHKQPGLAPLEMTSTAIGRCLSLGDTVIYESTVFPRATEEHCVPILARESGLTFNEHFTVGCSPERINPWDKKHRITEIVKVTSGSTQEAASFVDELCSSIIRAGTYQAESIMVAEAAKVIENTQRDVSIA